MFYRSITHHFPCVYASVPFDLDPTKPIESRQCLGSVLTFVSVRALIPADIRGWPAFHRRSLDSRLHAAKVLIRIQSWQDQHKQQEEDSIALNGREGSIAFELLQQRLPVHRQPELQGEDTPFSPLSAGPVFLNF